MSADSLVTKSGLVFELVVIGLKTSFISLFSTQLLNLFFLFLPKY